MKHFSKIKNRLIWLLIYSLIALVCVFYLHVNHREIIENVEILEPLYQIFEKYGDTTLIEVKLPNYYFKVALSDLVMTDDERMSRVLEMIYKDCVEVESADCEKCKKIRELKEIYKWMRGKSK